MTLAVVVATEPIELGTAAGLAYDAEQSLLERLLEQLASLNVQQTHVIARRDMAAAFRKLNHRATDDGAAHEVIESDDLAQDLREIARLARDTTEPMIILHGDIVASDELLVRLERGAKGPAAAVTGPLTTTRPPVRVSRHLIDSAGSRHHQVTNPDGVFRGVLRVAPPATGVLADAAEELALLVETPDALSETEPIAAATGEIAEHLEVFVDNDVDGDLAGKAGDIRTFATTAPVGDDVPALLLVGLVRSGVRVTARGAGALVCDRALTREDAAAARTAVEAVDEEKIRLDGAVKSNDGFFTTYAVSTYSRYIARWAAKRRLTPNMVTSFSMWIAVVAAVWFAAGTRLGMIIGGVLFYFSFVFDCVDGQLARYTRQYSTLGAWLDATFDRAKEYVVYAGLAVGSTAAAVGTGVHGGDVWNLAVATLILQTLRHMVDFGFAAGKVRAKPEPRPTRSLADPGDGAQVAVDAAQVAVAPAIAPATRTAGRGAGLGHLVVRLSHRSEKIPGLRWAKKIVVLPIGERFALISITAALFNAQVTFIALLVWGSLATAYTLTGRVLRSLAK